MRGALFAYMPREALRVGAHASVLGADGNNVRLVGLFFVAGAAITLGLHLLEAPEELYRCLYHHVLSDLDVPKDPSDGTVEAIRYVSLVGGILELAVGAVLLALSAVRPTPT